MKKRNILFYLSIGYIVILGVAALAAPWIAPHNPTEQNLDTRFSPSDSVHLLGTDNFGRDILSRVIYGSRSALLVGIVAGLGGGFLIRRASKAGWIDGIFQQLATLAVAVLAVTGAQAIGGNGFLAAFVAGLGFGWVARTECEHVQDFTEDAGQLLSMLTFFFFGAVIAGPAIGDLTWQVGLYAVLSLTVVRMIPVALSLVGSGLQCESVLFMGWFGPRGLASILFGLLIVGEVDLPGTELILLVVTWTVMLSIVVHGVTARPWSARYAVEMEEMAGETEMPEEEVVAEMPVRTFSMDWHRQASDDT